MNDIHYLLAFGIPFLLLGLISPILNSEFNSGLTEEDVEGVDSEEDDYTTVTIVQTILNLITIPFWTFGLPSWVNLWILLPIRIPFIFLIARNIWIGGGS